MTKSILFEAAALALTVTAASAQQVNIYGIGKSPCAVLSQVEGSLLRAWMSGLITGMNVALTGTRGQTVDVDKGVDLDILSGYVRAYCLRDPSASIHFAVQSVLSAQ
jgi:hypothetical protein